MKRTIVTKDELHVPQVIHDMECIFVDFLERDEDEQQYEKDDE